MAGNQLKYRALDIFTGLGPWYAETYINSILFLLSTVGKRLDLEERLQSSDGLQLWTIDISFIINSSMKDTNYNIML